MSDQNKPIRLTRRQAQVIDLLCQGHTPHEIAETVGIAKRTVDFHLRETYSALGVNHRVKAILAYQKLQAEESAKRRNR